MEAIAGVFKSRVEAERGVAELHSVGIHPDKISFLTPHATEKELQSVPTSDTEQPGIGKALGAAIGGAVGLAGGYELAGGLISAFIPGVGPIIAIGLVSGAILGALGAVGGGVAGAAIDSAASEGLPADELFVYEDALRQGRTVVIAFVDDASRREAARAALDRAGAESVDRAREMWWVGLRDVEKEHYAATQGHFEEDEVDYRLGFECALRPENRNKPYEQCLSQLRALHPHIYDKQAFRYGYERGQEHQKEKRMPQAKIQAAG